MSKESTLDIIKRMSDTVKGMTSDMQKDNEKATKQIEKTKRVIEQSDELQPLILDSRKIGVKAIMLLKTLPEDNPFYLQAQVIILEAIANQKSLMEVKLKFVEQEIEEVSK